MNFDSASLTEYFAPIRTFLETVVVTPSMGLQLIFILFVFALAYALARLILSRAEAFARSSKGQWLTGFTTRFKTQLKALKTVLYPLIAGTILWFAHKAFNPLDLGAVKMTSEAIRLAAILTLAWAVIRFASVFITTPELSRPFIILAWGAAALAAVGWLTPFINTLDTIGFTTGETTISVWRVLKVIVLLGLFFWLAGKAVFFLQNQINKTTSIAPSLRVLFSKISSFFLYTAAALIALSMVGIDLTAFAVFTGALGVGIGFGLQKIISNFISGIILLLDKSLKPGDVIEVETGNDVTYGWVEKLGLRYTSVTTRDGTETLIPNETFITNPVTNWSYSHSRIRRKLPIGVAYNSDVEKAMQLCVEAAKSVERVLNHPPVVCQLRGFGDNSVNLEVRFWLSDPAGGVKNVESAVNLAIWKLFQQHEIAIPFPQRDIHIIGPDGKALSFIPSVSEPAGAKKG